MNSAPDSCVRVEPELVAYLGSELSPEETSAVESHIAGCERCRRSLEEFRRTWRLVRALPMIEPSAKYRAALEGRIAAATAERSPAAAPRGGAAGRMSERLASRGHARARDAWAIYVTVAMAAVCAALFVTQFLMTSRERRPQVYVGQADARRLLADLNERRSCARAYGTKLDGRSVDLSPVSESGRLRLAGYRETAIPSARCVYAFDAIQWEGLAFRAEKAAGAEAEMLRGLVATAVEADVIDGRIEIPEELVTAGLDRERELTVMPLSKRTEIWATRILRDYLHQDYVFSIKAGSADAPWPPRGTRG